MNKDLVFAPPPRDHLTHPHGARVFGMMANLFSNIAKAAVTRSMAACSLPRQHNNLEGHQRCLGLVWRHRFPDAGQIQFPIFHASFDLTSQCQELKRVHNPWQLRTIHQTLNLIDTWQRMHQGELYAGCGLQFDQLFQLFAHTLKLLDGIAMAHIELCPPDPGQDDAQRDLLAVTLVLKDELDEDQNYDHQTTVAFIGPKRFARRIELYQGN